MAVIGCRPDDPRSLGSFLFSQPGAENQERRQRLILIWASRNLPGVVAEVPKGGDRPRLFRRLIGAADEPTPSAALPDPAPASIPAAPVPTAPTKPGAAPARPAVPPAKSQASAPAPDAPRARPRRPTPRPHRRCPTQAPSRSRQAVETRAGFPESRDERPRPLPEPRTDAERAPPEANAVNPGGRPEPGWEERCPWMVSWDESG